jgi:hypothetical protein
MDQPSKMGLETSKTAWIDIEEPRDHHEKTSHFFQVTNCDP